VRDNCFDIQGATECDGWRLSRRSNIMGAEDKVDNGTCNQSNRLTSTL